MNVWNKALMVACLCLVAAPAGAESKRIMVFGDSNSWGWNPVPEIAPISRYPEDVAWPGVMAGDLGADYEVINESLSARTAVVADKSVDAGLGLTGAGLSGAEYLPAAIASHMPLDLVIIMLGTNDVKPVYNRSVDEIAQDVMSLVAEVQKNVGVATSYAPAKVLVVAPPHLGKIADVDWVQAMFPAEAVQKSVELAGSLCSMAAAAAVPCYDGGTVAEITGVDGIHMTAQNHEKLGHAVASEVRKILE